MRALLLDLNGVLFEDHSPIPGAVEAVAAARSGGLILRFVTNTATRHQRTILAELARMGFEVHAEELFTAPLAARSYLQRRGWRPHCLIHPAISEVFADLGGDGLGGGSLHSPSASGSTTESTPDCVVLGDARDGLSYANLNVAFRLVLSGRPLLGIGMNRCFREGGEWMLDAGPFIRAIEWAAGTEAVVMGKPSRAFFDELVASTGLTANQCVMIGDDLEADVAGAMACGISGCLVGTGKARDQDRHHLPAGAAWIESIVDWTSLR
jgi:HAD superfamily hydrolase (TIGR01450 family)